MIENPSDPASTVTGSPRRITGSWRTGTAGIAATAAVTGRGAASTGTKMRHCGLEQAMTTASCASVRQDSATVGHWASFSRASTGERAPPSTPTGRPVKAVTAASSAATS
ncbi:hypothetical protein QE379_000500 [Sphingomonas sp. SORGH_AS 879]|nr:hypothetical protein [Sphingomonas sp. SORGH_AS_0879]